MTGEAPNQLTPRQLAVAFIAERIAQLRVSIDAQQAETRGPEDYFRSATRVFLEQTLVELRRAARHIQAVDMADDPEP